ncbi:MAG: GntR family transcriptional regulator [Pelolinea sp.]|nr:GntR family transcriptional regulator [Pelolinea sp.]
MFDRAKGIPVYRQLADYIKKQIASDVYNPGDILPSEADYIREFNISRTTVRLAFGVITNAGLVRREQGRGTIVVSQVRSSLPYLSSFTEEVLRVGREPGVVLLSGAQEETNLEAAKALALPAEAKILYVARLRLIDNEPFGLSICWLNNIQFPKLKLMDYSALSLYKIIEDGLGLSIFHAIENIYADLANENEAQQLKIKRNTPVLRIKRMTSIKDEKGITYPIDYTKAVFNSNMYSVDVELYRQNNK